MVSDSRSYKSTVISEMGNVLAVWLVESLKSNQTLEMMCLMSSLWRRNAEEVR